MFNHAEYIDRGVSCENCHADTVSGDGAVARQTCWNCHNQPQHLSRFGDTAFLHRNHVTDHKVECSSCHVQIVHHLEASGPAGVRLLMGHSGESGSAMADTGSCGQCHQQTHSGPLDMYRGTGGRGVPDMPSPMFRAQVDCIACHEYQDKPESEAAVLGMTFVAAQGACDKCHDSRYAELLAQWKTMIDQHVSETAQAVAGARAALDAAELEPGEALRLRRLLDDAEHNLNLVKLSRGLHNITYATALLNVATQNSNTIRGALGDAAPAAEDGGS